MFKKTAIVAGIALAQAVSAQAQQPGDELEPAFVTGDSLVDTYRWEINGQAGRTNWDYDIDDGDVDSFGVEGTFYFHDVDTTKGPRSEAAFLDHASDVSLLYVYTDADDIVEDFDGDRYGISGRYVLDTSLPLIFEGAFERNEPGDAEIDSYSLGFGAYVTDAISVIVTYADADADEGGDTDGWQVSAEHVWSWSTSGLKLSGNAGYINVDDADDIDVYNIAATWYITHDFGLGITTGYTELANQEFLSADIFAEWFITKHIALSALVGYAEADDEIDLGDDDDAELERTRAVIGATFRF